MPQIVILELPEKGGRSERRVMDLQLDELAELPKRCYAFLDVRDYPQTEGQRDPLLDHFGVPKFVGSRTCTELNGYFGCRATYDNLNHVTRYTTWFRCLFKMIQKVKDGAGNEDGPEYTKGTKGYIWYETTVFTLWDRSGLSQVLCIDTPFDFPTELQSLLARLPALLDFRDPFALHAGLVDQLVVYCDISVWRVRDPVRQLEKSRLQPGEVFEPSHEYSRHAIHVSEVLDSVVETLTEMQRCRTEIHKRVPDLGILYKEQAMEYAQFQLSLVKNLKRRSDSNRARLVDEINLAFNSLARQDNDFMKSIALLTMVFLPATFITAFFSTTFFSSGDKGWRVSGQLWIYWVVMIPATVFIMSLWVVWLAKGGKTPDFHRIRLKFPFRRFARPKELTKPKTEAAQV